MRVCLKKYIKSVKRIVIKFKRYIWDQIFRCFCQVFDEAMKSLKRTPLVIIKEKNLIIRVRTNAKIIECP